MKTTILLFLAVLTLMAESVLANDAPLKVKSTFEKMYSKVSDVDWIKSEDGNSIAFFYEGATSKEAHFKSSGTWLFSTSDITKEQLPSSVINYIEEKYPETSVFSSKKYEDPATKFSYQVLIQSVIETFEAKEEDGESNKGNSKEEDESLKTETVIYLQLSCDQNGKFLVEEEVDY